MRRNSKERHLVVTTLSPIPHCTCTLQNAPIPHFSSTISTLFHTFPQCGKNTSCNGAHLYSLIFFVFQTGRIPIFLSDSLDVPCLTSILALKQLFVVVIRCSGTYIIVIYIYSVHSYVDNVLESPAASKFCFTPQAQTKYCIINLIANNNRNCWGKISKAACIVLASVFHDACLLATWSA